MMNPLAFLKGIATVRIWVMFGAGLVLLVVGVVAGKAYDTLKLDLFSSFLFIVGILLTAVALSKTGVKPADAVDGGSQPEEPGRPAEKAGKAAKKRAADSVTWNI